MLLAGLEYNESIKVMETYFSSATDVAANWNYGMLGTGGGGGGFNYNRDKKWYFDAKGNPATGMDYINNIVGSIAHLEAQNAFNESLKNDRPSFFNVACAVACLLANATPSFDAELNGKCARNIRWALQSGCINVQDAPRPAYGYAGKYLESKGFSQITNLSYYEPKVGDIVVFSANSWHKDGHIQMWCGAKWVSDFIQGSSIYCGFPQGRGGFASFKEPDTRTPAFTIYRSNYIE